MNINKFATNLWIHKLIRAELRPGNVHGLRDYLRNVIPEGKIIIKTLKKILSKFLPLAGSRTTSLLFSLISHRRWYFSRNSIWKIWNDKDWKYFYIWTRNYFDRRGCWRLWWTWRRSWWSSSWWPWSGQGTVTSMDLFDILQLPRSCYCEISSISSTSWWRSPPSSASSTPSSTFPRSFSGSLIVIWFGLHQSARLQQLINHCLGRLRFNQVIHSEK